MAYLLRFSFYTCAFALPEFTTARLRAFTSSSQTLDWLKLVSLLHNLFFLLSYTAPRVGVLNFTVLELPDMSLETTVRAGSNPLRFPGGKTDFRRLAPSLLRSQSTDDGFPSMSLARRKSLPESRRAIENPGFSWNGAVITLQSSSNVPSDTSFLYAVTATQRWISHWFLPDIPSHYYPYFDSCLFTYDGSDGMHN